MTSDERHLIGGNVKLYREGLRMSQADLADALRRAGFDGVYPQTITKIEQGQRVVKLGEGLALARILGVEPGDLLTGTESLSFNERVELREATKAYGAIIFEKIPRLASDATKARRRLEAVVTRVLGSGVKPSRLNADDDFSFNDASLEQLLGMGAEMLKVKPRPWWPAPSPKADPHLPFRDTP